MSNTTHKERLEALKRYVRIYNNNLRRLLAAKNYSEAHELWQNTEINTKKWKLCMTALQEVLRPLQPDDLIDPAVAGKCLADIKSNFMSSPEFIEINAGLQENFVCTFRVLDSFLAVTAQHDFRPFMEIDYTLHTIIV